MEQEITYLTKQIADEEASGAKRRTELGNIIARTNAIPAEFSAMADAESAMLSKIFGEMPLAAAALEHSHSPPAEPIRMTVTTEDNHHASSSL